MFFYNRKWTYEVISVYMDNSESQRTYYCGNIGNKLGLHHGEAMET